MHFQENSSMSKQLVLALAITLGVVASARTDSKQPPEGYTAMFNGRDLKGWNVLNGKIDVWGVDNGVLCVADEGGGWLMTEKEYGDFDLRLEYRMSKLANSGVAVRAPMEGDPAYKGMEIQLIDDANWKGLRPTQFTGSIYDVVPPSAHVSKPIGEWNQMHITARGRQITVELN